MREQIEAVQRMQDYIMQNIFHKITLADLARVSLFSPWHAHRLFKYYTGITPAEYIRRLRLSKSVLKLRDEGCQVIEAAMMCGFDSVDGYQRAFRREFGCNPYEYLRRPVPLYLFLPYRVNLPKTERNDSEMEKTKNIFIQTVDKPARKVIIKRGIKAEGYWSYCEEAGCDVWGLLTSIKGIGGEPVCLLLPDAYRKENTSKYVQGVEVAVDYDGKIPEGFDVITLPEARYLMFQGEPFAEEEYGQAIEQLQNAIAGYDPGIWGYVWDECNPRIQLEPIGTRGYIELLPVISNGN
ncbi:MAG: AraC family transcriptional regulator [Bacillus sp. (in: Bacteria)]|nr:AraC family transcriptional regulator [Bacillus sp. (in: firmicutes)]MCM1426580.1 AraC family transcriptional regulator [Eubacterium sp.]